MTVIDNAVYVAGTRTVPDSLQGTFELLRAQSQQAMAWIGLLRPDHDEISSVAQEFNLHRLAVEDTVVAHQRPKLERYGESLFVVLRPARYLDAAEDVEVGELHVFVGADFVVTVRHAAEPDLAKVRSRLEADPQLLRCGPPAVLYAILDRVVDDYSPVVAGLQNDIDQIETEVFGGDPDVSRRIYQLSREVITFQRACEPLLEMLHSLAGVLDEQGVDVEVSRGLRDVRDHAIDISQRVDAFRQLLSNILTVNAALVGQRQNEQTVQLTQASIDQGEQVKRISSWAAILFVPTVIGAIYGMNFDAMPELSWRWGYPLALLLMLLASATLYTVFKRRGWL